MPRPSHLKKDETAGIAFRNSLAEVIAALDIPAGKEIKLWVYDEMRYGLHPLLRKMWSLTGERVVAPVNKRFKWGHVFGAFEVDGPGSEFLYADGLAKEMDALFLGQIAKSDPDKIHIGIGDGAGFHHKQNQDHDDALPANVRIITLPPYSPELIPVEKLWDVLKDTICNVVWPDLAALEDKMTETLKEWWERPDGFASLLTGSYLRSELNATESRRLSNRFY